MESGVQAAIDRLFEELRGLGVRDTRRPPDSGRRRAFRTGWHNYLTRGRVYDPPIMRSKLSMPDPISDPYIDIAQESSMSQTLRDSERPNRMVRTLGAEIAWAPNGLDNPTGAPLV